MSYNQNDIISGINHKDKKAWNMVYSQFYAALCAYVAKMIPESPDFITFLRHHMAHIENQLITSNNWVVLGGASEKHVPL